MTSGKTEQKLLSLSFSLQHVVGIAARLTFETVAGEKAESFLTVSNDGTAAIWYSWRRLLQQIPSRETKRIQCFYFDARPGMRTAELWDLCAQSREYIFRCYLSCWVWLMAEQASWVNLLRKPPWLSELTHTKIGVWGRSFSWDLKERRLLLLWT